jgi:hypothetical protein
MEEEFGIAEAETDFELSADDITSFDAFLGLMEIIL